MPSEPESVFIGISLPMDDFDYLVLHSEYTGVSFDALVIESIKYWINTARID